MTNPGPLSRTLRPTDFDLTTWEGRMAARAHQRAEDQSRAEGEAERLRREADDKEDAPTVEAYVDALAETLTDDDLNTDRPAIACACIGAPAELRGLYMPPCCCELYVMALERYQSRQATHPEDEM